MKAQKNKNISDSPSIKIEEKISYHKNEHKNK